MRCSKCGVPTPTASDEAVSVICGGCVQRLCAGEELRTEARLAEFDAAEFVELRKDHGWSQSIAAARIGVPISHLQEFERGTRLCPLEVADWMTARAEMP